MIEKKTQFHPIMDSNTKLSKVAIKIVVATVQNELYQGHISFVMTNGCNKF